MYHLQKSYTLNLNGSLCPLDKVKIMGIVNVTPDSFYVQSRFGVNETLIRKVEQHLREGADMIDIGACSTRPGSKPVSEKEEMRRLMPALELIRHHFPEVLLSVDTFRPEVAKAAVRDCRVSIINDVSGGDVRMFETVAECAVPYVLTHNDVGATADNSPEGVVRSLAVRLSALRALGVADVIIDPGFGFGKTMEENYRLLHGLSDFCLLNAPLLVGVSRKSMAYKLLGISPEEAINATSALHTLALQSGTVQILRVHDVKAAVECVKIVEYYQQVL